MDCCSKTSVSQGSSKTPVALCAHRRESLSEGLLSYLNSMETPTTINDGQVRELRIVKKMSYWKATLVKFIYFTCILSLLQEALLTVQRGFWFWQTLPFTLHCTHASFQSHSRTHSLFEKKRVLCLPFPTHQVE